MQSDEILLKQWSEGDREAGVTLVSRHYDAIVRFFQTKAAAEADDLVQRTFLACSEAAARYKGEGSFRAYLFGIARNILYEHIRKKMRAGLHLDIHAQSIADLSPGVSTLAAKRADARWVLRGMQLIPIESQVLVELYYWEDLSIAELAETFDIPPGTVKSRLSRARKQLRDALERVPDESSDPKSTRALLQDWMKRLHDA